MFYEDVRHIEELAESGYSESALVSLAHMFGKEGREDHFFKIVTNPEWLLPLSESGYFAPCRNPGPVESKEAPGHYSIPHWNVLDYLEKVASHLARQPDETIGTALMDIIRSGSDYRDDEGERIENYRTDWTFVKIMTVLPIKFLKIEDMDRIAVYLRSRRWRASSVVGAEIGKSLLPKLLSEGATPLAARLLDIILDCEMHERNGEKEFVSLVDSFWLNEALENNKPAIRTLFPFQAARVVLDRIGDIVSADEKQFSVISIPAVEDHPQNRFATGYQSILVRAARDFLNSAAGEGAEEARTLLEELLRRKHPIFLRIALHTISTHWPRYSDLFWPILESELSTSVSLKHELYELFKDNHARFSEEELYTTLDWIETRDYWTLVDRFEDEEQERRYRARGKLEWLTALKDSVYQEAIDRYETNLALTGVEPEHPGFSTWMGDVQVGAISPIEVSELLGKENAQIARYLIEYRDEGEWYGTPSREGLADAFKAGVANDPQKFSTDLSPFLELSPYYLYYLLWGFKDAWDAKRGFDWEAVLSFCLELTETDSMWMGPSEKDLDSPGWLVSQVADLIEAGTRDDSHAFHGSLLPLAEELLVRLLDKAPSQMYQGYDLLTAVLNSPKGRAFAAAINYSLRYARLRREEDPSTRWAPAVKEGFTKRLDRSFDGSREFSVTLGEYLANLVYLDKEWVVGHINEIFPKEDLQHWQDAMTGYLWPGRLHRSLYELLRDQGHYARAVETTFEEEHIRERLIQHLTVAYLMGIEQLDASGALFTRLVNAWDLDDLRHMVNYLWMQRGGLDPEQRIRVLSVWRCLFVHYYQKQELTDSEGDLVSELSKLAAYLDSIDAETLVWLRFSVRHLRTEQDVWFLIEYLHNLVSSSPHEVGLVYAEMLENDMYPTFDKTHITGIVEALYARGEKDIADRICNSYGSRGYDFLRGPYERHRDSDL